MPIGDRIDRICYWIWMWNMRAKWYEGKLQVWPEQLKDQVQYRICQVCHMLDICMKILISQLDKHICGVHNNQVETLKA